VQTRLTYGLIRHMILRFAVVGLVLASAACTVEPPVIEGRVVDALTEAPVKGARVSTVPTTTATWTDADGRFRIDLGLERRTDYLVRVTRASFLKAEISVFIQDRPSEVLFALQRLNEDVCNDGQCLESVTVKAGQEGGGVIHFDGTAVMCSDCGVTFAKGSTVTLHAIPDPQHRFLQWASSSEVCANSPSFRCSFLAGSDVKAVARFASGPDLRLVVMPSGSGMIQGRARGDTVECAEECTLPAASDLSLDITAVPAFGYDFLRWDAPLSCGANPTCIVDAFEEPMVRAQFSGRFGELLFERVGGGNIYAEGGLRCTETFCGPLGLSYGIVIQPIAAPEPGWRFAGWEGACSESGQNPVCTLEFRPNNETLTTGIRAVFAPSGVTAQVSVLPPPSGRIVSEPPLIFCGDGKDRCAGDFPIGYPLRLSFQASPGSGMESVVWGPPCPTTSTLECELILQDSTQISTTSR
jgi:hypothetical protein